MGRFCIFLGKLCLLFCFVSLCLFVVGCASRVGCFLIFEC